MWFSLFLTLGARHATTILSMHIPKSYPFVQNISNLVSVLQSHLRYRVLLIWCPVFASKVKDILGSSIHESDLGVKEFSDISESELEEEDMTDVRTFS